MSIFSVFSNSNSLPETDRLLDEVNTQTLTGFASGAVAALSYGSVILLQKKFVEMEFMPNHVKAVLVIAVSVGLIASSISITNLISATINTAILLPVVFATETSKKVFVELPLFASTTGFLATAAVVALSEPGEIVEHPGVAAAGLASLALLSGYALHKVQNYTIFE